MAKRILVVLLMVSLLLTNTVTSFAIYTAGNITYNIDIFNPIEELGGAEVTSTAYRLSSGSAVKYGVTVPFDATSVAIKYNASSDVNIKLSVDNMEYACKLLKGETEVIIDTDIVYYGDHIFGLNADSEVYITEIILNKTEIPKTTPRIDTRFLPDFTDYESAIETSVIFREGSNIIMVNGGKRYIDYEDYSVTPRYVNGSLYIPLKTLARALSCYYEENSENGYWFMRSVYGDYEFCRKDNVLKVKDVNSQTITTVNDVTKYFGADAWVPVRYFAEAIDEYVLYKDGVVIIDNKYISHEIADNKAYMENIRTALPVYESTNNNGGIEYHVAQTSNASDANAGTESAPFKTLAKAADVAKAGDTVIVHGGIYRETLQPKNNGTAFKPIIFKAVEGEEVIISANEKLANFVNYGENRVIASVSNDLGKGRNMIFYDYGNGLEAIREARYPNENSDQRFSASKHWEKLYPELTPLWMTFGDIQVKKGDGYDGYITRPTAYATSDTLLNEPDDYWKGGVLVSLHGYGWGLCTAEIESSTKGRLNLTNTTDQFYYAEEYESDCAYITCTKNAIDVPGEWAIEDNKIYMYPPQGETADSLKLEIKQRQLVANLENSKYIELNGFKTIGGSIKMNNSEMCVLNGMEMKYANHHTLTEDHRDGYVFEFDLSKPGAPQTGEVGVYIGGSNNAVINSTFEYSAAAALYITGKYCYIENNLISECGYMGSYTNGICMDVESWEGIQEPVGGHTIVQNTIRRTGRGAISAMSYENWNVNNKSLSPLIPVEIAYNDLYETLIHTRDGGATYWYMMNCGNDKLKSRVHHNLVWDVMSGAYYEATMGLYNDNGIENVENFGNIGFYTDSTYKLKNNETVYSWGTENYVLVWDNPMLGVREGKASFTQADYANGQVFDSGCYELMENRFKNYELFNNGTEIVDNIYTPVAVSDGAVIKDGIAKFTDDGQWVKFENVKVPASGTVEIYYSGNPINTGDSIELVLGDSIDNGTVFNYPGITTINSTVSHPKVWEKAYFPITTSTPDTIQTLYIKINDYKSIIIKGIKVVENELEEGLTAKVYGGYYSSVVPGNNSDATCPEIAYPKTKTPDPVVTRTWYGTVICYKDVVVDGDSSMFAFEAASENGCANGEFEVRLNSSSSTPILKTTVTQSDGFDKYAIKMVEMDDVLKAGVYDIYLTFKGPIKTCNFYWFGFVDKDFNGDIATETEFITDRVFASSYSAVEGGTPEKVSEYAYSGMTANSLKNITTGTKLSYDNINVTDVANSFVVSLNAVSPTNNGILKISIENDDGEQLISQRVDVSSDYYYKSYEIPLERSISAGEYNVSLEFEGEDECITNISWFAFAK